MKVKCSEQPKEGRVNAERAAWWKFLKTVLEIVALIST